MDGNGQGVVERRQSTFNAYLSPSWQSKIEELTALCQSTTQVLLLLSPPNGGKSTFLNLFMHSETPYLRKQAIAGGCDSSIDRIMQLIASGFGLRYPGISDELDTFEEEGALQSDEIWVLIVDDAHLLDEEKLISLIKLVNFKAGPTGQMHLILLGDSSLEQKIRLQPYASFLENRVEALSLAPWSLEDILAMLKEQYSSASISKTALKEIVQKTHGIPGEVKEELSQLMDKYTPYHKPFANELVQSSLRRTKQRLALQKQRSEQEKSVPVYAPPPPKVKSKKWVRIPVLGVALGAAFGISYLMFVPGGEPLDTTAPKQSQLVKVLQTQPEQVVQQELVPPTTQTLKQIALNEPQNDNQEVQSNPSPNQGEVKSKELESTPFKEPEPAKQDVKTEPKPKNNDFVPATSAPKSDSDKHTSSLKHHEKVKAKAHDKLDKKNKIKAKHKEVAKAHPSIKKEAEKSPKMQQYESILAHKKPERYTLQLLGAYELAKIQQFKADHQLKEKGYIIQTKRNGKEWYVFLYGDFDNKQMANRASLALPNSVYSAKVKPWVRSFDSVKAEMTKNKSSKG